TAFKATYGTSGPNLGVLAEYDALEGMSQVACSAKAESIPGKDKAHGCGHNLFAGGSLAAVFAVKAYIEETGNGRITLFGCPAEEGGGGKVFMARDGAFEGIESIVSWHPERMYMVRTRPALANVKVDYTFEGIAAHAGAAPDKGRSALDAVELMNVGVNFLREHVIPEARLHYAFQDVGGGAPNVVQDRATVLYYIRAPKTEQVMEIYPRVVKCAEGAAHMTETQLTVEIKSGLSDYIPNDVVSQLMSDVMMDLGPIEFSDEAKSIADDIFASLSESDIKSGIGALTQEMPAEQAVKEVYKKLITQPFPYKRRPVHMPGSTDVGDVSYVVPTAQLGAVTSVIGTPGHSWQQTAQSGTVLAHEGLNYAAKIMAITGAELIHNPELAEKAKAELNAVTGGVYNCPIPKEVKPQP
ncbi:MAG: amidohydrolase, partial [Oscillospiraceae bacterium]|nr:amidohydrolase [Oscillospiraceae bacterium]